MSWIADNIDKNKHCFFGVEGGISTGIYESLNTNIMSGDDKRNVHQNHKIIASRFCMNYENMLLLRQGVSNVAILADEPSQFQIQADGAVTDNPNILLCLKTADCAPVLLADFENHVIGVAHAGWRGAYKGIVENVLDLMLKKGADRRKIKVAIGPCLQQKSFAVKEDMRHYFLEQTAANDKYFLPDKDNEHFYFDLSGYLADKLISLGIEHICNSKIDTYSAKNGYFSYRRNTHLNLIKQKLDYPTQLSCLKL